jgi:gluconate 2-dehydrogenase subunit 3-like protein
MKSRRAFLFGLLGLPLLGGAAMLWRNLFWFWRPRFNEHIEQTVMAVTNLMFPGDGLPGATALGIHNRILAMPDLHALMMAGVDWLDEQATRQGAPDFLALDEAGQLGAVEAAFGSKDDDATQLVFSLRYQIGLIYYSEPVIKAAFPYTGPPQPEGFADFVDAPQ